METCRADTRPTAGCLAGKVVLSHGLNSVAVIFWGLLDRSLGRWDQGSEYECYMNRLAILVEAPVSVTISGLLASSLGKMVLRRTQSAFSLLNTRPISLVTLSPTPRYSIQTSLPFRLKDREQIVDRGRSDLWLNLDCPCVLV